VPESESDTSEAGAIFSHPGEPGGHGTDHRHDAGHSGGDDDGHDGGHR
jgi:hypothetical protein